MFNAVVLGGGGKDTRLEGTYDGPSKGLIKVGDKTCLAHVLTALEQTDHIDKVALIGPEALNEQAGGGRVDVVVEEPGSIVDKLMAAVPALGEERKMLVVCCDTPLLTPEGLTDVLEHVPEDCAFFHPLVEEEAARQTFPDHLWTTIKLREGRVVTTNVFVVDPKWLLARPDLAETIEKLRRHPVRMALRCGIGFLFRFKLGLLSVAYCEGLFSRFLGAPCRTMICRHVGMAMDLDRPADAPMLAEHMARERT